LLFEHAFEVWQVHSVCLRTDVRNQRSRSAIERVGATFEGVRRAHSPGADGTVRSSAFFSIIAEEWPSVRARLEALINRARSSAEKG
jgi:N-acetyltransferase